MKYIVITLLLLSCLGESRNPSSTYKIVDATPFQEILNTQRSPYVVKTKKTPTINLVNWLTKKKIFPYEILSRNEIITYLSKNEYKKISQLNFVRDISPYDSRGKLLYDSKNIEDSFYFFVGDLITDELMAELEKQNILYSFSYPFLKIHLSYEVARLFLQSPFVEFAWRGELPIEELRSSKNIKPKYNRSFRNQYHGNGISLLRLNPSVSKSIKDLSIKTLTPRVKLKENLKKNEDYLSSLFNDQLNSKANISSLAYRQTEKQVNYNLFSAFLDFFAINSQSLLITQTLDPSFTKNSLSTKLLNVKKSYPARNISSSKSFFKFLKPDLTLNPKLIPEMFATRSRQANFTPLEYFEILSIKTAHLLSSKDFLNQVPSPMTIKAVLVNTANQFPFSQKTNWNRLALGWGVPDFFEVLKRKNNIYIREENGIRESQISTKEFYVHENQDELKITLSYMDPQSYLRLSKKELEGHMLNHLDLLVIDPQGNKYVGNFGLLESPYSKIYPYKKIIHSDRYNNIENVFIKKPIPGKWTVQIKAVEINKDQNPATKAWDNKFSLVIYPYSKYPIGDISMDYQLNYKDIDLLNKVLRKEEILSLEQLKLADLDQDGSFTPKDYLCIKEYLNLSYSNLCKNENTEN